MKLDPISATDEELVAFCKANRNGEARIVRLSEAVLIKFGIDVTAAEFANQQFVWEHTSASTFRVPKPIRYFQDRSLGRHLFIGYLIMEFIHGTNLSSYLGSATASEQEKVVDGLIQALDHLAGMPSPTGQGPGPIGGAPPRGYLWSDGGINSRFNSLPELEDFLNTLVDYASGPNKERFDFVSANLVMCHTDLAPRNILKLDDGRLALLDWANSGCYPRIFEIYALRTRVDREPIFNALLSRLPQEAKDEKQIELLASIEKILLQHGDFIN
jgi:hypothetical protein